MGSINSRPLTTHGFSIRFYTENIFKYKIEIMKEKDYNNFKLDCLIVNTCYEQGSPDAESVIEVSNLVNKRAIELKLSSHVLYNKQNTSEFNDFFVAFRMRLLIIVKYDESCKNEIFIEYKTKDRKKTVSKE